MLAHVDSSVLDSMTQQLAGLAVAADCIVESASSAASDAIARVDFNEEQAKAAYSHVYKFIQEQEKGGAGWKPRHTGLTLTEAPPGKGRSMWVSPEGMPRFLEEGKDAIKQIGRT